jgi:hypothetical protein
MLGAFFNCIFLKIIFSSSSIFLVELKNDCCTQFTTVTFYQALLAEVLGTFLLVIFVCGFGLPITDPMHQNVPQSLNGCLGSGLIVRADFNRVLLSFDLDLDLAFIHSK